MKTTATLGFIAAKPSAVRIDIRALLLRRVVPVSATVILWAALIEGVHMVWRAF